MLAVDTVDLDDDLLAEAKDIARKQEGSIGRIISYLVRQSWHVERRPDRGMAYPSPSKYGVAEFQSTTGE